MNKNKLILTEGFKGVNIKGQGVRPAPENPGNVLWSKDDVVKMVYDVAPTIFRKSNKKWWVGTGYDEEDFTQDAVMDMLKRYDTGYIDITSPNLKKIIYSLLNGFFIFNKAKSFKRKRLELDLDSSVNDQTLSSIGKPDFDEEYVDLVADTELDPEEQALLYTAISRGKKIVDALIESLSVTEFSSRKYNYKGTLNGKPVSFSEQSLAKLFLSGKTANEIIKIFNINQSSNPNQAITVKRKVQSVIDRVASLINNMNEDDRFDVKVYLYSVISDKPGLPSGGKATWRRGSIPKKV